ncbi:MAG: hypothetical protein A4E53_03075 [Pelotomaculum sp. PtaB.Bin104]|nr:MAG: hypothetical protein A4E53_03075 [Pelotomaculum sp. PtaB.Bin104]
MFGLNLFNKKKVFKKTRWSLGANQPGAEEIVKNKLEIILGEIVVRIVRDNTTQPQNELTAVIPRAEIRRKYYQQGQLVLEEEVILNSITLVDAPSRAMK